MPLSAHKVQCGIGALVALFACGVEAEDRKAAFTGLRTLESRSYKTYMARLKAANRLAFRNRAWNASLIASTTASTLASVALLVRPHIYGEAGPTLLVFVAVLTLVTSLVTSSLNYSARSRDMFRSYRRLQALSAEAERLSKKRSIDLELADELHRRYDAILDETENHTTADHKRAQREIDKKDGKKIPPLWREPLVLGQAAVSFAPYATLAAPIALLIPLATWIAS